MDLKEFLTEAAKKVAEKEKDLFKQIESFANAKNYHAAAACQAELLNFRVGEIKVIKHTLMENDDEMLLFFNKALATAEDPAVLPLRKTPEQSVDIAENV